jgi:hypothetical protein
MKQAAPASCSTRELPLMSSTKMEDLYNELEQAIMKSSSMPLKISHIFHTPCPVGLFAAG